VFDKAEESHIEKFMSNLPPRQKADKSSSGNLIDKPVLQPHKNQVTDNKN
jgi:hypothetical protein